MVTQITEKYIVTGELFARKSFAPHKHKMKLAKTDYFWLQFTCDLCGAHHTISRFHSWYGSMIKEKVIVSIEGYGVIRIAYPSQFDTTTFADGIAEAVSATCQLLDPRTQAERFHPAIGRSRPEKTI